MTSAHEVIRFDNDGFSVDEISEMLGARRAEVRKIIERHRAMQEKIRRELKRNPRAFDW